MLTKPFTKRELVKSIIIGVSKGLFFYFLINVLIIWLILNYAIPLIANQVVPGINLTSLVEYEYFNYSILILFIVFSTVSTIISRHVSYGSAFAKLTNIAYMYVIIINLRNIEYSISHSEYGELRISLNYFILNLFYLNIALCIANMLYALAREYKKKHESR